MDSIVGDLSTYFLRKESALRIFAEHDCRVEGWFKGETLLCLDGLRHEGRLEEFEREFSIGARGWGQKGQKIDLRIRLARVDHLCELKALCISQAYGTARNLDFYFREGTRVGLSNDFRKLEAIRSDHPRWILSFIYPAPSKERWERTLQKWSRTIGTWSCLTSPNQYPDWLFVALWRPGTNLVA